MKQKKLKTISLVSLAALSAVGAVNGIADQQKNNRSALLAYLRVKPGTERQFLDATRDVIEQSRKESGNIQYNLQQSTKDPQQFAFYELFQTHEDLLLHRNSKHVKDFLDRVNPILAPGGFVLDEYKVLSASGDVSATQADGVSVMTVSSKAVAAGSQIQAEQVFNGFGCTGKNVSPDLSWTGAPEGTKSFAVTVYDQDAPTGSGWWHWTVFNIPAGTTHLDAGAGNAEKNALPAGAIQGRTDFGTSGYGGPCPPVGDRPHRYIIKVYALKDMLPLDPGASGAMLGFYIHQMKLAEGTLEARFGR